MITLLLTSLALADDPGPQDIRVPIESGAVIDWTDMVVEVSSSAQPSGVDSSRKVVETTARRPMGDKIARSADRVRVNHELVVSELRVDPSLGQAVTARATRWSVTEARYFASGRIELVAQLPLSELLRPWTLSVATEPPEVARQPRYTGVVLDARGTGAEPAFSPRILNSSEAELYSGHVWRGDATSAVPVIYVPDPAHPASARAGDSPLFVKAERASGCDLVLDRESSIAFKTGLQGSHALGKGTIVVVIDP